MQKTICLLVSIVLLGSLSSCSNDTTKQDTDTTKRNVGEVTKKEPNYKNDYFDMYLPDGWEETSIEVDNLSQNLSAEFTHRDNRHPYGTLYFDIHVDYCNNSETEEVSQQDLTDEFIDALPYAKRLSDYEISGITFSRFKQFDTDERKYKFPIIHIGKVGDDKYWISVIFYPFGDALIDDYYTMDFRNMLDSLVLRDLDWDSIKDKTE